MLSLYKEIVDIRLDPSDAYAYTKYVFLHPEVIIITIFIIIKIFTIIILLDR